MAVSPGHCVPDKVLNAFHMRSLRRILNITWQDKVPNNTVLEGAGCASMYTLLKQRRMLWLGHDDGQIPKDLLYGKLVQGKRPTGRPQLRFKDVCKRDLKVLNIDQNNWEAAAGQPGDRLCRRVSPSLQRHSLSSSRKRD